MIQYHSDYYVIALHSNITVTKILSSSIDVLRRAGGYLFRVQIAISVFNNTNV